MLLFPNEFYNNIRKIYSIFMCKYIEKYGICAVSNIYAAMALLYPTQTYCMSQEKRMRLQSWADHH